MNDPMETVVTKEQQRRLAENIAARREAAEMMEFIGERSEKFWALLGAMVYDKLPPVPEPVERNPPMDEQEAIRFEASEIPYGKHKGTAIGEVPLGYLLWMTEGNEFDQSLRRYVRSKRFQERQDDE